MKRFLALMFLAAAGAISGAVVGAFNTGLVPLCGDPCNIRRLGQSVTWGLALMVAFPVVGWLLTKQARATRVAAIGAVLSLAALLPAAGLYGYRLHQFYWQSSAPLGVPDVDFSYMVIATKPVIAMQGNSKVRIKAWERCAIGPATCGGKHRSVEAICLGSKQSVSIDSSSWSALQRVPDEDLPGLQDRPQDTNWCSP